MNPNDDLSAFLGVYLDEAVEQLQLLEDGILRLESALSDELLQEVFRAAHTLKGSSRAMGFGSIGDLTHAIEDVFDLLRSGRISVSTELADGLFGAVDQLKNAIEEIAEKGTSQIDFGARTCALRSLTSAAGTGILPRSSDPSSSDPSLAQTEHQDGSRRTTDTEISEAWKAGLNVHKVVVSVSRDCPFPSIRAFLVLQSVEQIGTVLQTTPGREAIENEEFDFVFSFLLATEVDTDSVARAAQSVSEIDGVSIADLMEKDEPNTTKGGSVSVDAAEVAAAVPNEFVSDAAGTVTPNSGAPTKPALPAHSQTVRVDVARLDSLLNLVGELVIDCTRLTQIASRAQGDARGESNIDALRETASHIGRITSDMQQEIMKARMQPLDNLFARFPRMVRDLASKLGKEIEFTVEGRDTELDRSVIEVIGDPLIHLLRNCIDHGIELPEARVAAGKSGGGHVYLRARHEESQIVIEIEDDGKGIDPDLIRAKSVSLGLTTADAASRLTDKEATSLIFAPGFSTVDAVSDISGRGVGMDIVRSNLTRFGAHIEVDSRVGQGTRFAIKLPLTLAIIRGLLVKACGGTYVLPLASVIEAMELDWRAVHRINHRMAVVCRGAILPLIDLTDHFGSAEIKGKSGSTLHDREQSSDHIVVIGAGAERVGVIVNSLVGEQEIVIKSLGNHVGDTKGISGATILGDGCIALIVDVNGLLSSVVNSSQQKVEAYAA